MTDATINHEAVICRVHLQLGVETITASSTWG